MVRPFPVVVAVAAAAAIGTPAPARADTDQPISIAELVDVAVRQSSSLTLIRASVRSAKLGTRAAGAAGQVRLQASVGVQSQRETPIDGALGQLLEDTHTTGSLAVAKQLPTGGDVSISMSETDELRRFSPFTAASAGAATPVTPDPVLGSVVSLSIGLSQPLLRGLGQGASVDVREASIAAEVATFKARDDGAATIRDLIAAYWELAYARANLEVRKQSLALAQSQLDLTRKMHDRGAVPDSAVKSARYGVAVREEATVRARDGVEGASMFLRRLAGLEIGIDVGDLSPTEPLLVPGGALEATAAITAALAHNPRIAAAQRGVAISDVELGRRRNAVLPAVDLAANAGASGSGIDRTTAFDAVGTPTAYQFGGSLTVHWEVGGAASAGAEIARVQRSNARVTAKDVERDVVVSVIDAARSLRAAQARAALARSAIELALANLDTELALFRADKSNNVLVFQRQTELDEARLLESRAAADCLIALATLDYLSGQSLDRHGVEIVNPTRRSTPR